jgi:hypothetical protein
MKKKIHRPTPVAEPSEQAIRDYAYHLYLLGGQIPGRDFENWLEAKACLKAHIPLQHAHARLQRSQRKEIIDVSDVPSLEARNLGDELRL